MNFCESDLKVFCYIGLDARERGEDEFDDASARSDGKH